MNDFESTVEQVSDQYKELRSVTLVCYVPPYRSAEREYCFRVILGDWLGLSWVQVASDRRDISIELRGQPGELRLPDTFFGRANCAWLQPDSLPKLPMSIWDVRDFSCSIQLTDSSVPVIFGEVVPEVSLLGNRIAVPLDIFGSAFFMLTRYEEVVCQERDRHDRFPSEPSAAFRGKFLDRPIIDEYVEILWVALQRLWPALRRKRRAFEFVLSHDVDRPSRYGFASPGKLLRRMAGDLVIRGDISSFIFAPWIRCRSGRSLHPADPANTFDWMMSLSEQHGIRSAFYFISGTTDAAMDADYEIGHPAMRDLLRRVHARGHEIGLHPSYNTYLNPSAIVAEAGRLRAVCAEEGISQDTWGARMHYLRWRHPETLHGLEQAGMAYDCTLTYADRAGFRCGTCREYQAFDPILGSALKLRIQPLIAMEGSVMEKEYMGKGAGDAAFQVIRKLKNACRSVNGNFTLLWHNSELEVGEKKALYERILDC